MSWPRLPLPEEYPDGTRCIQLQIPDSDEYLELLLGMLQWLAFWDAYDRDEQRRGKDVAALWRETLETMTTQCAAPDDTGSGVYIIQLESEESEESMKPCFEKRGDQWYIGLPCGDCGGMDWIPLGSGSSSSSIGGSAAPGGDSGGVPPNTPLLPLSGAPCFKQRAAEIYIDRMVANARNLIDLIQFGLDSFSEPTDIVDGAASAIDMVTSGDNYTSLAAISKSTAESVIRSYEQAVANNWPTTTAEVTRNQLASMAVDVFPELDNLVPVQLIATNLALFGNMRSLNAALAIAQAECFTGSAGALASGPVILEVLGNTYEVAEVPAENLGTVGVDVESRQTGVAVDNIAGVIIDLNIINNGNNSGHGVGYDDTDQWRISLPDNADGTTFTKVVGVSQDLRDALKEAFPTYANSAEEDVAKINSPGGGAEMIIYDSGGGGLSFDSDVTPNAMYIVTETT